MLDSNIIFEMSNGCFLHVRSLLLNDSIAALNWVLTQVSQIACRTVFTSVSVGRLCCITLLYLEHRSPHDNPVE